VKLARHFSERMEKLFGEPRRPHAEITQRDMDLAFALQHRFEEVFFHLLNQLHTRVPLEDLAMAGGCALNSVANGKLFDHTPFRRTYIQPAAGDEGLAIGAALHTYHSVLKQPRRHELKHSYLGPEFSESRIQAALQNAGFDVISFDNGLSAYQRLREEPFELLLTDIVMPEMDGIELARRAAELDPDIKIMFITGFAAVALNSDSSAPKHAKVLSKPIHLRELVNEVQKLLAA